MTGQIPPLELGSAQDLLVRLTAVEGDRQVVFLVGAGLTMPLSKQRPGVPGVRGMVQLIHQELRGDAEALSQLTQSANAPNAYQEAFRILRLRRGPDTVNRVIRRAVWNACSAQSPPEEILAGDPAACKEIERTGAWSLTPGIEALGKIVALEPSRFGETVLTTNFDPLIEISIRRASGQCYRTILHADGAMGTTTAEGCRVVHLHGFWYGADTLHTPMQLTQPRPRLKATLEHILRERILVVLGFGGWDDVFTGALADVLKDSNAFPDVLWTFYAEDPAEIASGHAALLARLSDGIGRGRLTLFMGINAHDFLPRLVTRLEAVSSRGDVRKGHPARLEYLRRIELECRQVRLGGIERQLTDPARAHAVEIDSIYVPLDAQTSREESLKAGTGSTEQEQLATLEAVARRPLAVLLGLPGSGKSCFLQYLAKHLAYACEHTSFKSSFPGWSGPTLLPVLVRLANLADDAREGVRGAKSLIEDFLRRYVEERMDCSGFGAALLEELRKEGGIVLCDGLDEVAPRFRWVVRDAIVDFAALYPKCRFVVTCRTFTYKDPDVQLTGWPEIVLAPLDEEKIKEFIRVWFAAKQHLDPASTAIFQAKRASLEKALISGDSRLLNQIADSPLLLTVMAVVHTQRELPDARAAVYKECVDLLLHHWQIWRTPRVSQRLTDALQVPSALIDRALQEVAYKGLPGQEENRRGGGAILEHELTSTLYAVFRDFSKVETFLKFCESSNGLLLLNGRSHRPESLPEDALINSYTFIHPTFQEYLAGLYLRRRPNLGTQLREHLDRDPRWREVILLLAEYLCFSAGDSERVESVLRKLVPWNQEERPNANFWRAAWLAGDILIMLRRLLLGNVDEDLERPILAAIVRLVETAALTPKERAAAARTLAAIGDPRPGVEVATFPSGLMPEIRWGFIPGGTLLMGANSDEIGEQDAKDIDLAYPDEVGPDGRAFPVQIRPFYFSIHPVTLSQFRCFSEGDGYKNPDYWTADGWEWVQWRLHKLKSSHLWERNVEQRGNQPVSPVYWHEAVAFCRWLTQRFRDAGLLQAEEVIRLPTESEWEWAARGPEGRWYPWGEEWRADACNSYAAGIGEPCAVGLFPAGKNWTGELWDMTGNVLEWCSTKWDPDYSNGWQERSVRDEWDPEYLEGREIRVLRGGYHVGEQVYKRVTRGGCRFFYSPRALDRALGYSLRLLRTVQEPGTGRT